jgi:hypothetical protein
MKRHDTGAVVREMSECTLCVHDSREGIRMPIISVDVGGGDVVY